LQAARNGGIDMIFAAQMTPERSEYLLYSAPYIELPNMIVVKKNFEGELTLEKMRGMKIICSQGSAVQEFLKANYGYLDIHPVEDEMSGLLEVSFGEAGAMVVEISRASYLIEKAKITNLRVAGNAGYNYELRFASRKDWPVLNRILDKGLAAIPDSARKAITKKWIFGSGESIFDSRKFWITFVTGASAISLVFLGIVLWNRVLKAQVRQRTRQLQQELMERRQAEEALRRQSEFLQTLLETIPSPIFYKGVDGRYLGCNRAFEEFLGLSRQEIIGKTVYEMGPRQIADRYHQADMELLDHPGKQHYE
jgi:PAS domain-containing protein